MGKVTNAISNWRPLRILAVLAGLLLFAAAPAFSQGCSLCYTQAASSGSKVIQALKAGILVLIIPPTLGSIGMLFVVHRKNNQIRRIASDDDWDEDWKDNE